MTIRLEATPFFADDTFLVEHEGAALDTTHLLAVHHLLLHHAKQVAHRLIRIRQQGEGKSELGFETFMRFDAVARQTDDLTTRFMEFGIQVAELLDFGGASRCVVLG